MPPTSGWREGAAKLGYSYRVSTLNIDPDRYDPKLIGYSGMGDQTGAKQGTMRTFLQDASDAGAKLLPNTFASGSLPRTARPSGSRRPTPTHRRSRAPASSSRLPWVVAAAGALETPGLLLRSGIGGPAVGAELRLHPAGVVSGIYEEPQDPGSAPGWPAP